MSCAAISFVFKSRKDDITKPFEKLMADIQKSLMLRQRRFAARAVASELDTPLGNAVGYKVRFSDKLSSETYIT